MPTKARELSHQTLKRLCKNLGLVEVRPDDGPYLRLRAADSPGEPVGEARLFTGEASSQLVYIGLTVEAIGLDSHMLFAFTPPDSALPHFTLDSVFAGEHFAFHCDLIPRVDLAAHLGYMDTVYGALTERFTSAERVRGLVPAQLSPRQRALMSPWMLAFRAHEQAFDDIAPLVSAYTDHWLRLVGLGLDDVETKMALAKRDREHRAALFNPDVDPVWSRVERLVGKEPATRLRELLKHGVVN
jgi:hypothetical protein